jgi:predicted DNA-binding transcriptional regulator YafY
MRADRLLSLLLLLQGKGRLKAAQLAARLEVSRRTIHRDVEALSMAGVPVYAERGPTGGIVLLDEYRTRLTGLSREEAEALVAAGVPRALADIGLGGALRSGLVKLSSSLPAVHQLAAERLRQRVHVDVTPWFHVREVVSHLPALRDAVLDDRALRLRYRRKDGRLLEEDVKPYGLVAKAESWYLVAETERGIRVLRVARIESAVSRGSVFERRPGFDLQAFWDDWARRFEARCTGYAVTLRVGRASEEHVAESLGARARVELQRARRGADGAKIVAIDFEKEAYALASLGSLGRAVEVIDPPALRARLLMLGQELSRMYERASRVAVRNGVPAGRRRTHRLDVSVSRRRARRS